MGCPLLKRRLQLYPRGRGLLLPSLARPHCRCPLGPVTLYQEVAAAASLALVCMSFPLVPWATFFSGCLGNQPLLLEGEEGPKSGKKKKKKRQPLFAGRSLRMSSRPTHLFPFWRGNPWEFPFLLLPGLLPFQEGEGTSPASPNHQDWPCCNTHFPTQCFLCLDREGKKRRGINKPDRARLIAYL